VSDWLAAGGEAAGGLMGGVTGLLNIGFNRRAYWRQLQREDTAVQRRAKDMEAAGVNPLLAAGQPAQSTPQAQQKVPDLSGFGKGMEAMMNRILLHKANTDISRTEAETRYTDEQTKGVEKRNALIDQEFGLKERGVSATEAANSLRQAEINIKEKYTYAQIRGIDSTIARNSALNTLTRDQSQQARANIYNLYSMVDYRDAQRLGQLIENEFKASDFEKLGNTSFPRGTGGWLTDIARTYQLSAASLRDLLNKNEKPEGMSSGMWNLLKIITGRGEQVADDWTASRDNKSTFRGTGSTGSWDTPQSGSDRAPPMQSGTGMR